MLAPAAKRPPGQVTSDQELFFGIEEWTTVVELMFSTQRCLEQTQEIPHEAVVGLDLSFSRRR